MVVLRYTGRLSTERNLYDASIASSTCLFPAISSIENPGLFSEQISLRKFGFGRCSWSPGEMSIMYLQMYSPVLFALESLQYTWRPLVTALCPGEVNRRRKRLSHKLQRLLPTWFGRDLAQ